MFDGTIAILSDGDAYISARPVSYVASGKLESEANPLQFIEDIATAIAATGVQTIKGEINVLDDWKGDPLGESWSREDTPWGYGAPATALTINDNQLKLTLTPGQEAGDYHATAAIYPDTGFYNLKADVATVSAFPAHVVVDHSGGPHSIHIYGTIPPGAPFITEIAIDDPPLFAAETLKSALIRHGVNVESEIHAGHDAEPGQDPGPDFPRDWIHKRTNHGDGQEQLRQMCLQLVGSCRIVAGHVSPTLAEDVAWTLKTSQNLHAEIMLRRLADQYGNDTTARVGAWVLRQWLLHAGLDGTDFVFYDGSGLSAKDLVTPRTMAQLLAYTAKQKWFSQWKAALPIGGVDGTLSDRFKTPPLKDHVFAKTGTLGESRALSGYLDAASGRTLIFSILVDNHTPGTSADRSTMDKIVAAIAAAN